MTRRGLAAALLLFAGGCAQGIASAQTPTSCATLDFGGYTGDARCAALARQRIRGADRVCQTDADCVVLANSAACEGRSVASAHAARYASLERSCVPPSAGPCNPVIAFCSSGCCSTR